MSKNAGAARFAAFEAVPPNGAAREGMLWVPGGTFLMGSDSHYPEEAPAHKVSVDGFWMDRHTVTNAGMRNSKPGSAMTEGMNMKVILRRPS